MKSLSNINISGASLRFPLLDNYKHSMKRMVLNRVTGGRLLKQDNSSYVVGLENISLSFESGDRIALLGHNGAGKSTLLRLINGVYSPTVGTIHVEGTVSSLLDIGLGIDPDASGIENIFLRMTLDGIAREEIEEKIGEIIEFSGLGEYIYLPVKTYSSGMALRLAFSIVVSCSSSIILMDEWLSVGDQDFSKKATERLESVIEASDIFVFASHDLNLANSICNKFVYMESGKVIDIRSSML